MKKPSLFFVFLGILALNSALSMAQDWKATLTKAGANYTLDSPVNFDPAIGQIGATQKRVLEITCSGGVNCTTINLQIKGSSADAAVGTRILNVAPLAGFTPTTTMAKFEIDGTAVATMPGQTATLQFLDGTTMLTPAKSVLTVPDPNPNPNPGIGGTTTVDCQTLSRTVTPYINNRAEFVVSHLGNVLSRPADLIDEDDKIIVRVVGPRSELNRLVVQRKSTFREVGSYRILGEGTPLPNFQRMASEASDCTELTVELADFSPGRGLVELARRNDNGAKVSLAEFDFGVHPLYRGAFSFGPVYSWLTDRSFGTVAKGTDNIITITEQSPKVHYVVSYTHYIWGRVDAEKSHQRPWYQHIYPTFGLALQNTLKNVFVGTTYDIFGTNIYLTGGAHIGRVTVIDPQSGLAVGTALPAGINTVPTRTETQADWYLGISLDLRAAAKLFGLFGTGAASQSVP